MESGMRCRDNINIDHQECMSEHIGILRQRVRQLNQKRRRANTKKKHVGSRPTDQQLACFIYEVSSSMTAIVLWVVHKSPATLKEMPSRTDMEEVIGHWIAITTAAMKLA
jgi:hypothetical protein